MFPTGGRQVPVPASKRPERPLPLLPEPLNTDCVSLLFALPYYLRVVLFDTLQAHIAVKYDYVYCHVNFFALRTERHGFCSRRSRFAGRLSLFDTVL